MEAHVTNNILSEVLLGRFPDSVLVGTKKKKKKKERRKLKHRVLHMQRCTKTQMLIAHNNTAPSLGAFWYKLQKESNDFRNKQAAALSTHIVSTFMVIISSVFTPTLETTVLVLHGCCYALSAWF